MNNKLSARLSALEQAAMPSKGHRYFTCYEHSSLFYEAGASAVNYRLGLLVGEPDPRPAYTAADIEELERQGWETATIVVRRGYINHE